MASTLDMAQAARAERPLTFLQELERAAAIDRARGVCRELEREGILTPAASYRLLQLVKDRGTLHDIGIAQMLGEVVDAALRGLKGGAA